MKKILIIDDDPSVLGYLERLIQKLGYETETANCCKSARTQWNSPEVGIIISDLYLPDNSEIQEWIEELITASGERPLILITGESTDTLVQNTNKAGVLTCLTKPFELSFLKTILKENESWINS